MPSVPDHHAAGSTYSIDGNRKEISGDRKKRTDRSKDSGGKSLDSRSRHKRDERERSKSRPRYLEVKEAKGSGSSLLSTNTGSQSRRDQSSKTLKSRAKGLKKEISSRSLELAVQNITSNNIVPSNHERRRDQSNESPGRSRFKHGSTRDLNTNSKHGSSGDLSVKSYSSSRSKHGRRRNRSREPLGRSGSEHGSRGDLRSLSKHGSSGDLSVKSYSSSRSKHGRRKRDQSKESLGRSGSMHGSSGDLNTISKHGSSGDLSVKSYSSSRSKHGRRKRDQSKESLGRSGSKHGSRGDLRSLSKHGSSGDLSVTSYSSSRSKHGSAGDVKSKSRSRTRSRHRSNDKFSANLAVNMSGESQAVRIAKEALGFAQSPHRSHDSTPNKASEDAETKKKGRRPRITTSVPGVESVSSHRDRGRDKGMSSERLGIGNVSNHRDKDREKAKASGRPGIENVLSPGRDKGRKKSTGMERPGIENVISPGRDKGRKKSKGMERPAVENLGNPRDNPNSKLFLSALSTSDGNLNPATSTNASSTGFEVHQKSIDPEPLSANDLPLAAVAVDETANEERIELRVQEAIGRMMQNRQKSGAASGEENSGVPENSGGRHRLIFLVLLLVAVVGGGLTTFIISRPQEVMATELKPTREYQPPSEEECQKVREQKPVTGQDDMIKIRLEIEIEVIYSNEEELDAVFAVLVTTVQEKLVPELAGCTQPNRRGLQQWQHARFPRRARKVDTRPYPIANANVTAEYTSYESCSPGTYVTSAPTKTPSPTKSPSKAPTKSPTPLPTIATFPGATPRPTSTSSSEPSSESCRRAIGTMNLELFVIQDADPSAIIPIVEDVFEVTGDQALTDKLELSDDGFNLIRFLGGGDGEPSGEPSRAPSGSESDSLSEEPSSAPSDSDSSNESTSTPPLPESNVPSIPPSTFPSMELSENPTRSPVIGPTTEEPTRSPSRRPTPRPTQLQTSQPTPLATLGSSSPSTPPLTPAPTPPPTQGQNSVPTPPPTPGPTLAPIPVPTPVPTLDPTPAPTQVPTPFPTPFPTPGPTMSPTKYPTSIPTPSPTPGPTSAPTESPTDSLVWEFVANKSGNPATISSLDFRSLVQASPNRIIRRMCSDCDSSHQDIYYKRLTDLPAESEYSGTSVNFLDVFLENWYDSPKNKHNVDFELYSSYDDALTGQNRWQFCNFNDKGIGFPRDCDPTTPKGNQWNSLTHAQSKNFEFFVESVSWGHAASKLASSTSVISDNDFRILLANSPNSIVRRQCDACVASHQNIFYKRLTPLPDTNEFDGLTPASFIDLFINNWFSSPKNLLNVDFELYSTYKNALLGTNRWQYCNYDDPTIGFPRDCGPNGDVHHQWNSLITNAPNGKDEFRFWVETTTL